MLLLHHRQCWSSRSLVFYSSQLTSDHLGIFVSQGPDTETHSTALCCNAVSSISSSKYPVRINQSLSQYFNKMLPSWNLKICRSHHHDQPHPAAARPGSQQDQQVHQVHWGRGAGVAGAGLPPRGEGGRGEGEGCDLLTWTDLGRGAAHNILWVLSTIRLEFLQDFRWSNSSGGRDNNSR